MSRSATAPASAGRPRKSPLRLAAADEPSFPARREVPGQAVPPGGCVSFLAAVTGRRLVRRCMLADRVR
jgi:hypothetical protein